MIPQKEIKKEIKKEKKNITSRKKEKLLEQILKIESVISLNCGKALLVSSVLFL